MKVTVAGYNIESELIEVLREESGREVTPEVISAAYARISRDPRSVSVLRREARKQVEKARRSNERIVFGMGHSSIAEHVVFNVDVSGISRLAVEALEHFRLASFTEKSQRYIRLGRDTVVPDEVKDAGLESEFRSTVGSLHKYYKSIYGKLLRAGFDDGIAKEDARYVMPLATSAQLGMTVNARELEYMVSCLSAHPLAELRVLAARLQRKASAIAPSLIRYPLPTEYARNKFRARVEIASRFLAGLAAGGKAGGKGGVSVKLIDYTRGGDGKCVAAILFGSGHASMSDCMEKARGMSRGEIRKVAAESFRGMEAHDSVWREFETISVTFEIVLSASAYAQLKRHRMATLIPQDYSVELGTSLPESVKLAGAVDEFRSAAMASERFFRKVSGRLGGAALYILLNAHRRRVLFHCNMRELYHFSRLRSDRHAQWEIREISEKMCGLVRRVMPVTSSLLAGKDRYEEVKAEFYNKV